MVITKQELLLELLSFLPKVRGSNFKFAFLNDLAENNKKRKSREIGPSLLLLNATNLQERPVCLKEIISPPHSYSHQFFHFLEKNLYSAKSKLYSAFDSFESPVEWSSLIVDSSIHSVEYLKKGANMQTLVYESLLSSVDSTHSIQESTSLNRTQQNYAQWAREFINTHRLKRGECKNITAFQKLPKSKKQAIYYQLRKNQDLEKKISRPRTSELLQSSQSLFKKSKKRGVITNSKLLKDSTKLVLFILIEAAILNFSHNFYLKMGLGILWAWAFAFLIEATFTVLTGEKQLSLKLLRIAIFFFSAFTICYSTYVNDPFLQSRISWKESEITSQKSRISELERRLFREVQNKKLILKSAQLKAATTFNQIKQLDQRMNYYKSVGDSYGLKKLSIERYKKLNEITHLQTPRTIDSDKRINILEAKLDASRENLISLEAIQSKSRIISWENFKSLELNTYVWMSLMLILQVASSFFITSVSRTFKTYFKQKDKQQRKRNFNEYSSSYLGSHK